MQDHLVEQRLTDLESFKAYITNYLQLDKLIDLGKIDPLDITDSFDNVKL